MLLREKWVQVLQGGKKSEWEVQVYGFFNIYVFFLS